MVEDPSLRERKYVSLRLRFKQSDVEGFTEHFATNISRGGMFVYSKAPHPAGTHLQFEFQLAQGTPVFQGTGVVRWARSEGDPGGLPGMGIQFIKLEGHAYRLVDRMLELRAGQEASRGAAAAKPVAARPTAKRTEVAELPASPSNHVHTELDALLETLGGAPIQTKPVAVVPAATAAKGPPPLKKKGAPAAQVAPVTAPAAGPVAIVAKAPPPPKAPPTVQPVKAVVSKGPTGVAWQLLKEPDEIPKTGPVIGIDLGTTNSCVAIMNGARPTVIQSSEGYNTIPSAVSVNNLGKLLVGRLAKEQQLLNPRQTIYGAKRLVGRSYESATVQAVKERFQYEICADAQGLAAVKLSGKVVPLEQIQAFILRECKQMAARHLNEPVHRAVITVPAYYTEVQRQAVRRGAALAGLRAERIVNEPTAAALAYGLNRELARKVLVYDLGGGTFDATLLRVQNNVFEVLATGGDTFLGGMDFDQCLVDVLIDRFQSEHGVTFEGEEVALSRIVDMAERAKVALSQTKTFEVELPMLMVDPNGKVLDLRTTLNRTDLEEAVGFLVDRTLVVVRKVLDDARMKPGDLDEVILVGGQSRMPMVRDRIRDVLGRSPHAGVHADEAVAQGAALLASTVDQVSSLVLVDVLPVAMGIGLPGGKFQAVIATNTSLPAKATVYVRNAETDERTTEVHLFQGEGSKVAENDHLGTVEIRGVPMGKKGQVKMSLTLRLDPECQLSVEARDAFGKELRTALKLHVSALELRKSLQLSKEEAEAATAARTEELSQRGGSFWGRLRRAVSGG